MSRSLPVASVARPSERSNPVISQRWQRFGFSRLNRQLSSVLYVFHPTSLCPGRRLFHSSSYLLKNSWLHMKNGGTIFLYCDLKKKKAHSSTHNSTPSFLTPCTLWSSRLLTSGSQRQSIKSVQLYAQYLKV